MIIRTNNKEVNVKSIFSDVFKRNGKTYPALRVEFENEAIGEDVQALLSGSFEIVDDNGEVMGTHEGYNTLKSVSVVVGKITTDEQKIEELEAVNAELTTTLENTQAEKEELQNAVNVIVGGESEEEGGNA